MSSVDPEEEMEVDQTETGKTNPSPAEEMDRTEVYLTLQWADDNATQKKNKMELQKALLSWANKSNIGEDFDVVETGGSGALIKTSSSALSKLEEACGQTLSNKGTDVATLVSVHRKDTTCPPSPSLQLSPFPSLSAEPQGIRLPPSASLPATPQRPDQPPQYSAPSMAEAAVQTSPTKQEPMQVEQHPLEEETFTCNVPITHYWFVSHVYKDKIARIEKDNGVKIQAEVTIKLEPLGKNGDPRKAFDEFTKLVQRSSSESEGFTVDFKYMTPEALKDTLSVVQDKTNKVLLRVSADEMFVCGPDPSQDAISKSLNAIQKTLPDTKPSYMDSAPTPAISKPTVTMNIDDPLMHKGLTMEQSVWREMTGSFRNQVSKLKDKFDVDFKEAPDNKGRVNIKAFSRRTQKNTSMESHAIRALLHLYRKVVMPPAQEFANRDVGSVSHLSWPVIDQQPAGVSGGAAGASASENGASNTEKLLSEAAAEAEAESCSICLGPFTDKVQLSVCKHEFCRVCLDRSKKSQGDICPLCKDVFGVLEGNQPQGTMKSRTEWSSLPGFPGCNTIVITYVFPDGKQTERHPNPGQPYSGTSRKAFLPDNREGREVLSLLERAFKQKLVFTVGRSMTSNLDNQVTWNDIHHKTNVYGGPQSFGYPDDDYLSRVKDELKAKGIK